jgi:hypothetical protein
MNRDLNMYIHIAYQPLQDCDYMQNNHKLTFEVRLCIIKLEEGCDFCMF